MTPSRTFLLLQGPISPFFKLLDAKLESMGHSVIKINLNLGDQLLWPHKNRVNYRGSLANWPEFITHFYESKNITDLILLGEQRDYHREAIDIAKQRGINVVVTDFGYLRPDWITLEHNGMSAQSEFPNKPDDIIALSERCKEPDLTGMYSDSFFNQALWDVIYHVAAIAGWIFFPGYDNFRRHNPVQDYFGILIRLLRRKRVLPRAKKSIEYLTGNDISYFVYPLQLQHDYSIQAYSPYTGNEQPIEDILRSFAKEAPKDTHLVVKIHPLDPSPFKWRRMVRAGAKHWGIEDRVHYIDGGDLNQLLFSAQGVITINSTTGIATLQLGIATKILGQALYDVEGLVSRQSLDDFWKDPDHPNVELRDAFIKALTGTIQLKGTYYQQPGLGSAVEQAALRLDQNKINQPL